MSKLIRFDEDHFGYLTELDLTDEEAHRMGEQFAYVWPEKKLIIMRADEFIDLTGSGSSVTLRIPVRDRPD